MNKPQICALHEPGVIVGGVLLAGDELFGMEQLPVSSGPDFVDDGGFQIDEDGARHVLSGPSLGEERVERVVTATNRLVRGHLSM